MKNPCLVIIDVQEKLYPVVQDKENFLRNLEILIRGFKILDLPIIVTEQVPQKLGHTVNPVRSILKDVEPISKSSFSCASDDRFNLKCDEFLDVDGYVLAGIETHICVYQTERHMSLSGKHVEVVVDAVSSRNKTNHDIALDRIRNNGGFLTTAEMILFELKGSAEGNVFKQISKLVK
tara:strand:+ start:31 stop:564 length:534 start_codon:yes stop_codon:yes gene_type:complete